MKLIFIFIFAFFFFSKVSYSNDSIPGNKISRIHVKGYIKDMQTAFFVSDGPSLITGNFIHNRINFRWDFTNEFHFRVEARNRLFYGEQVKTTYQFGKFIDVDNGLFDLSYNLIDDTSVVMNVLLDRLLLNWTRNKWDITIGRQRINWGVNLVWNPNDIFNAFNYFDFDYEERPGSDALRIQYNTGNSSTIELAYKITTDKNEQVAALLFKTNLYKYDWQNFAGIYYNDIVLGTGWAGNLKNIGFKGEASYFHPYKNSLDTTGILSASISFDRSFKKNYFAMASYLYNSNGESLQNGVGEFTGTVLSAKKLMPFKHSFFFQVNKSFSPIVNGGLAMIFSPQNNTMILISSLAVSISDNWDLALFGQSFFSDVAGVYRTLGNLIFLRLQWSF